MILKPLDPFDPQALDLLAQSDAYHAALYPAESNHLVDPAALQPPAVCFLGAWDGARLLGCGAFRRCTDGDGAYAELKRLFVPATQRGRGVARALMTALERRMAAEGLRVARLETGIHQPEALQLYRALGYRERAPFGDYAPDPLSRFLEKRLEDLALRLEPLGPAHLDALAAFEHANRAFFEAHINARPVAYYTPEGLRQAVAEAQAQRAQDQAHAYLVFDATGALVARANLTRVRRAHFHSAELGYRVAEAQAGRGIATAAVGLLLARAFGEHGLRRVEALVHAENPASLRVLARHGFRIYGRSQRSFELGGRWLDTLHHERHAP